MDNYQTTDLISVDQALAKGRQMLMLPRILMIIGLFLFLFPIVLLFMAITGGPELSRNTLLVFIAVLIFDFMVFFLPLLFWSCIAGRTYYCYQYYTSMLNFTIHFISYCITKVRAYNC